MKCDQPGRAQNSCVLSDDLFCGLRGRSRENAAAAGGWWWCGGGTRLTVVASVVCTLLLASLEVWELL